jgi:hypothetical protein
MKRKWVQSTSIFVFFATGILCWHSTHGQDSKKEKDSINQAVVKNWIEAQHFTFVAQFAVPMNGRSRNLTSLYELVVKKDKVEASLPYFGKAYSVNIGDPGGGIQFKSADFDYDKKQNKNGGWDISIKPKDVTQDSYRLNLLISTTGMASLQVSSNSRQSISFNGFLKQGN